GKVIIVEYIIPEVIKLPDSNSAGRGVMYLDNTMLAHNPAGKESSQKQFENRAKDTGLTDFQVWSVLLMILTLWNSTKIRLRKETEKFKFLF
ncbi:hypothetical protein MKW98_027398, partial [Papaver atlanticum]